MNGLAGRMAYLPAPSGKRAEFLFVYGHHSSLERWQGLLEYFNNYGAVTAADMPGFGGMTSFYAISIQPTLDNYADYLAAFVKLRFRRKKVVIVGASFGFVVATRMLQRNPELRKHVRMLISLAGFTHGDDFTFSRLQFLTYRALAALCSLPLPARLFRVLCLNRFVLTRVYARTSNARHKFADVNTEDFASRMQMEIHLWQHNDVRTQAYTLGEMLTLDNCRVRVDIPVWHVSLSGDQFLDNSRVEQHLQVAFKKIHLARVQLEQHAPSIVANEAEITMLVPAKLRRVLSRL